MSHAGWRGFLRTDDPRGSSCGHVLENGNNRAELISVSYINVNRNMIDPETRRRWERPHYEGLSGKAVAVVKFETLSGEPIALYDYAMHAVTVDQWDLVGADAPG